MQWKGTARKNTRTMPLYRSCRVRSLNRTLVTTLLRVVLPISLSRSPSPAGNRLRCRRSTREISPSSLASCETRLKLSLNTMTLRMNCRGRARRVTVTTSSTLMTRNAFGAPQTLLLPTILLNPSARTRGRLPAMVKYRMTSVGDTNGIGYVGYR